LIRQKITALEHKGRYDQSEYDNLVTDHRKVTQHKRLSYGKLSEALLYSIRAKHQTVREAFLKKNLTKLVSKHANPELNISKCSLKTQKTNDCVHALNQSLLHIILLGDYIEQGGGIRIGGRLTINLTLFKKLRVHIK